MAKKIQGKIKLSSPIISERYKFTAESASSPLSHGSAPLTKKVHRWTARRGAHISTDSKTRGSATTKTRRKPMPRAGEMGPYPTWLANGEWEGGERVAPQR